MRMGQNISVPDTEVGLRSSTRETMGLYPHCGTRSSIAEARTSTPMESKKGFSMWPQPLDQYPYCFSRSQRDSQETNTREDCAFHDATQSDLSTEYEVESMHEHEVCEKRSRPTTIASPESFSRPLYRADVLRGQSLPRNSCDGLWHDMSVNCGAVDLIGQTSPDPDPNEVNAQHQFLGTQDSGAGMGGHDDKTAGKAGLNPDTTNREIRAGPTTEAQRRSWRDTLSRETKCTSADMNRSEKAPRSRNPWLQHSEVQRRLRKQGSSRAGKSSCDICCIENLSQRKMPSQAVTTIVVTP